MPRLRLISALVLLVLVSSLLAACGGAAAPTAPTPPAAPTAPAAAPTTAAAAPPTAEPNAPAPTAAGEPAAATAAPAATTGGGTLTIGIGGAPDSLNPGVGYLTEAFDLYDLVYDQAVDIDLKGQYHPMLVDSYTPSADGKTWTLKVHQGVKWHDGQPLTAEDIAFTYNMIIGFEEFGFIKSYTTHFVKAEVSDPATVKLTLDAPVGNMEYRLSVIYILPKHIWEKFADQQAALGFENVEMVGTGPFMMEEYKQGEFTKLKANKEHFQTPPKIDEVIFKTYANPDALVQALKAGEVDLISELPNTTIASLKSESTVKVESGGARDLRDIFFNVIAPENCPKDEGKCTGHPALKDVKVRQALAYATDKQQLIDVALLGLGSPGLVLVPNSLGDWYNSSLQDYAYDPEKAKQILEDAGYKDSDGDGIREMPNDPSKPLQFRFHIPSDILTGAREGEMISGMWKEVGVQLDVQILEPDTVTSICCPAFDYDVILWGWSSGPDPDLLNVMSTQEIPTGTSETGYSNPEYDQLFEEQETTVDQAKRKEIVWKMQEIMLRDVPYIIPYYQQKVQAYRSDRFQGWVNEEGALLYLQDRTSLTMITPIQ
jgi:peptide/nickel transport system substrate-binding protein